ncbi:MAG: hypothetical protein ACQCN5_05535 [Candidatus Bathyarchaeia archaeon]
MSPKKRQEKITRGWLPSEPADTNYFANQTNEQPKIKRYAAYVFIFTGVFLSVFLVMSVTNGSSFAAGTAGAVALIITIIMLRKPDQSKPLTGKSRKVAKIIGITNFVMAGVFLGTYFLINPIIQSVEATLGVWIVLLSTMFLVNTLLYKNFKKRGFREAVK